MLKIVWVKAHRSLAAIRGLPPAEQAAAWSNRAADLYANKGSRADAGQGRAAAQADAAAANKRKAPSQNHGVSIRSRELINDMAPAGNELIVPSAEICICMRICICI